jgi:hypothetical protein|eukprot:SAG25_NODE_241_length_11184_cov_4.090934_11_plen_99_part_00
MVGLFSRRPARLVLLVLLALLRAPSGAEAKKMEYGQGMRLQNPPEGLDKPGLKCSACVVACDAIRHELKQVTRMSGVCRRRLDIGYPAYALSLTAGLH